MAAGTLLLGLVACDKKLSVGPEQGTALYPREVVPTNTPGPATPISDPVDISPPASPTPASSTATPIPVPPMLMFLSSGSYDGILGGAAGAAATCESLANLAGMGGTWAAFLSDSKGDLAGGRISDVGPWYLVDGKLAFNSLSEMILGEWTSVPNVDELGVAVPTGAFFWTGTSANGLASAGGHCSDWSINASISLGTYGDANQPFTAFYNSGSMSCAAQARLMCVQQTWGFPLPL